MAGWRQCETITSSEFYSSLALCFEQPVANPFRLMDGDQTISPNYASILSVDNYFVIAASSVCPLSELNGLDDPITYLRVSSTREDHLGARIISSGSPAYPAVSLSVVLSAAFRDRIRTRDQRCMVSLQDDS